VTFRCLDPGTHLAVPAEVIEHQYKPRLWAPKTRVRHASDASDTFGAYRRPACARAHIRRSITEHASDASGHDERAQGEPGKLPFSDIVAGRFEAAIDEGLSEAFFAAGAFTGFFGPCDPARVEFGAVVGIGWIDAAALLEPSADGVFFGQVGVGCIADGARWGKAEFLPIEAALNAPCEDARTLGLEFFSQLWIAFVFRDGNGERIR